MIRGLASSALSNQAIALQHLASPWRAPLRALLSHSVGQSPQPVEIKLRKAANRLDVTFSDGKAFSFAAEFLRVKDPSADNYRTDARGLTMVKAGRRHVGIMALEPVGNYAVRIMFDDLHQAGIFTWPYLYDLGLHKLQYSKQYITALRERGLSRDPPRSSKKQAKGALPGSPAGTKASSSSSSSSNSNSECSSHGHKDGECGHDHRQ